MIGTWFQLSNQNVTTFDNPRFSLGRIFSSSILWRLPWGNQSWLVLPLLIIEPHPVQQRTGGFISWANYPIKIDPIVVQSYTSLIPFRAPLSTLFITNDLGDYLRSSGDKSWQLENIPISLGRDSGFVCFTNRMHGRRVGAGWSDGIWLACQPRF